MRGKLTILALALGLLGMNGSMDRLDLIILSPDNNFTKVVEQDVAISQSGGSGPLLGTNFEFSCGACKVATFDDATTQIGSGIRICGVRPQDLVTSEMLICGRSTLTGNRSNVDLETWRSGFSGCVDANGGRSCPLRGASPPTCAGRSSVIHFAGLPRRFKN